MRADNFWRMATLLCAGLITCATIALQEAGHTVVEPTPTPNYDPFATPVLPENPSQEEIGKNLYFYHCMPCHGDLGQGLTDEFRSVWEEDHQNCWGRSCHGGRASDEGFPLPTIIPPVIQPGDALTHFSTPQTLFDYLKATHPPQEPGRLTDSQYQALTAYLWAANGKPDPQTTETPISTRMPATSQVAEADQSRWPLPFCSAAGILSAVVLIGALNIRRS